MGKQHCSNLTNANAFIKGLRKASKKSKTYINWWVRKKKNKDGSYLVTWRTNWRV